MEIERRARFGCHPGAFDLLLFDWKAARAAVSAGSGLVHNARARTSAVAYMARLRADAGSNIGLSKKESTGAHRPFRHDYLPGAAAQPAPNRRRFSEALRRQSESLEAIHD